MRELDVAQSQNSDLNRLLIWELRKWEDNILTHKQEKREITRHVHTVLVKWEQFNSVSTVHLLSLALITYGGVLHEQTLPWRCSQ